MTSGDIIVSMLMLQREEENPQNTWTLLRSFEAIELKKKTQ